MLGLFFESWFLFPQFIAKVETANEDRITMELPTKWDETPLGFTLKALLWKISPSKAAEVVAVWATGSMVVCPGWELVVFKSSAASVGGVCISLSWLSSCWPWSCVLSDASPDPFLYFYLETSQSPYLIPLSDLVSHCVNGIKNRKPLPDKGNGCYIFQPIYSKPRLYTLFILDNPALIT